MFRLYASENHDNAVQVADFTILSVWKCGKPVELPVGGVITITLEFKKMGLLIADIAKGTGLSIEEVEKL